MVTVFRREVVTRHMHPGCGVLSSPVGGLELLTPEVVTLGIPSGDEYRAVLDDKNVGGV